MVARQPGEPAPTKRPKEPDSLLDIYNDLGKKTIPHFQTVNPGGTFETLTIAIEIYLGQFIKK